MSESDHVLAEVLEYISELEADIPGVRSWVGGILVGQIPLTNEVTVYELADLWGDVQNILEAASTDAQNLMGPVLESWTGDAAAKFGLWWEGYLDGLNGLVDNAAQTQQGVQNFGLQIETMKFMAVLGLIMMLITIFQLIALAWGTLGISAVGVWPTIKATGLAIAQAAKNVLANIARITWKVIAEFIWDLIRLSPKQIVARSMADTLLAQAGKFLPDEVLAVLKEMAPEGVSDLMAPAMAQVRNELRNALVQAQLRAWTEAGTSLATTAGDDVLGQWAGRQIGEQTFAKAMWLYLRPRILNGIAFMGGGNLLAQLFEVAGGERHDLNLGELTMSAAQGAVFGAAMWGSPAGHVLGSTAASAAFALVGDALKGGVDDKGKPVDWLGDVLSGARSGFEAGVVFGIHSALPEMNLGTDPVMPEGGRVTGFGELDGALTINVERDGVQVMARQDYVAVSDTNSGAKLVVRGDGTFDKQGEFSASRPEPPAELVVEADPPGTTYQRPAAEPVFQETETPVEAPVETAVETPAEAPAEAPSSGAGTQAEPVVVEADAQPKQVVVEAVEQPKQVVVEADAQPKQVVVEADAQPRQVPASHPDVSVITSQTDVSAMTSISPRPNILNMAGATPPWHGGPFIELLNDFPVRPDVLAMMHRSGVDADVFRQALERLSVADVSAFNDRATLMAIAATDHGELGLVLLDAGLSPDQMRGIAGIGAPADLLKTLLEPHTGFQADYFTTTAQKLAALLVERRPAVEDMMAAGLNGQQIVELAKVVASADETWPEVLAKLEARGMDPGIRIRLEQAGGFSGLVDRYFASHRVRDAHQVAVSVKAAVDELKQLQPGTTVQLLEALDFVEFNDPVRFKHSGGMHYTMSLEGSEASGGNADLLHFAIRDADGETMQVGAGQLKVSNPVTFSAKHAGSNLAENLRKALSQLHGEAKNPADAEVPPADANLHAPVIIVNHNDPMYWASREDILQTLPAYKASHGISADRMIVGTDENARAILIEIRNGTGTHLFSFDDFPLDKGIADILGDGTLVQRTRSLIDGFKDPTTQPTQEAVRRLRNAVGKLLAAGTDRKHENDLLPERYVKALQDVRGTLKVVGREFAPGKFTDPVFHDLLDQAVAKLEATLTGDLPEISYPERPPYPHTFTPKSITDGTNQIVNQFQGFGHEIRPADLGPQPTHAAGDVFARIVDVETALLAAPAPGDIDPHLIDRLRDAVNAVLTAGHDLTPEQVRRLESLKLDLEAIKGEFTNDLGQKLRPLDGLERNLLSGTMVKIAHTLAGGVPEAADVSSSPHQIPWITPGTAKYVNQWGGEPPLLRPPLADGLFIDLPTNAAGEEYGQVFLRHVIDNLPSDVRKVVDEYTKNPFINNLMRAQDRQAVLNRLIRRQPDAVRDFFGTPTPTLDDVDAKVALLDKALRASLPEGLVLHRALRKTAFMERNRPGESFQGLVGTVQKEPGYLSASLGAGPPDEYFNGLPIQVHLYAPADTEGLWIGPQTAYAADIDQRELLLPRDTRYEVTHVQFEPDGKWHIYGKVLPPAEPPAPDPFPPSRVIHRQQLAGGTPTGEELHGLLSGMMRATRGTAEIAVAVAPGTPEEPGWIAIIEGGENHVGLPNTPEFRDGNWTILWHTQHGRGPSGDDVASLVATGRDYELVTWQETLPNGQHRTRTEIYHPDGTSREIKPSEVAALVVAETTGTKAPWPQMHSSPEGNQLLPQHGGGSGYLHAAANPNVDIGRFTPAPVWRTDSEPLWRFESRGPEEIFQEGFQPLDVNGEYNLDGYIMFNHDSPLVSTTRDPDLGYGARGFEYDDYRYEITAPHGIDLNATFPDGFRTAWQREVSFPGGIDTRFIKGVWVRDAATGRFDTWMANPNYDPGPAVPAGHITPPTDPVSGGGESSTGPVFHDHAAVDQAIVDAEKARIENAAAAEVTRIENEAAADVARSQETMQHVLEQAKSNFPAMRTALEADAAKLARMRLRMFGEAVPPEPKVLAADLRAQQTALRQLDAQHAASLRFSATLKEASKALIFMKQLGDAYQARIDSARQYLEQYDAEAAVTPSRGLLQASETRWRQALLDHLADQATRALQDARELHALVEHVLNLHQGGAPDKRLAAMFADFTKSSQDQAVAAVQDALLVHQHFTDNGLIPLLEGSDHLTAAWTEQRDALAHSVRRLRAQLIDLDSQRGLAGRQRKITQVGTSLNQATQALQDKENALRDRWLKDPGSLPTQKAVLEKQISDLRVALPEAWRRGDQAAVWSISDDLNRAEAHIAWIDQQQAQAAPKGPAGDPTAVRQALGTAAAPAFQQRYSDLTAEALRTHLDDQLSAHGLQETWHTWERRRREGYVTSITDLTGAQAKLHALQNDPAAPAADIQAQQAVVNDLAAHHAAWHTHYPGDVPDHQVGAGFRDVAIPGQLGDLTALGNPKDWPVAVSVEKMETPPTNYYHAHRNVLKDFFTAKTAAPDVIGGRLPIELTQETGHWKVQLNDGTVLDVRAHKPVSLVIDSGPAWRGGLSMLRLDGGLGDVGLPGHLPQLVGKVGPIAVIGSLSGRLGNVDLQYNPVLRRDFYTYEHIDAQTLDIKVLSDPNNRFPKKWQIETPGRGTVLTGVEKTLQFYTKWGVQAIAVPMLQFAWGDPAHGVDSLVPFLQIGGVGVAQITGEIVNVSDATTLRPLRTEWSVGAEWLVGDFISLPSHIGGVRLHPDVSWLRGWDPGPGTVMTNYVKGIDLTPFVKHYGGEILAGTPWLGDVIRRRVAARQQAEEAQLAAVAQHDDEVRRHLKTLKKPGSEEQR